MNESDYRDGLLWVQHLLLHDGDCCEDVTARANPETFLTAIADVTTALVAEGREDPEKWVAEALGRVPQLLAEMPERLRRADLEQEARNRDPQLPQRQDPPLHGHWPAVEVIGAPAVTRQLEDDDYRASLAWLRALLTSDLEGLQAVARNVDRARLVEAISLLALALAIDPDAPVPWVDRAFEQLPAIALGAELRRQKPEGEPP